MAELLVNRTSNFLSANMSATQTNFTLVGTIGFPLTGQFRVRIDSEILIVTSVGSDNLFTVTRGAEGTTATPHNVGTKVTIILSAGGLMQYVAEQIALEDM